MRRVAAAVLAAMGVRGMQRPKLRAVALDLDGTLCRSDGSVSDATVEALSRFVEGGGRAFIVTGRGRAHAVGVAQSLETRGVVCSDVVCSDGAVAFARTGPGLWDDVVFEKVVQGSAMAAALERVAAAAPGACFGADVNSDDGVVVSHQRYLDVVREHNAPFFDKMLRGKSVAADFWGTLAASPRVNWVRCIGGDGGVDLLEAVRAVAPDDMSVDASTLNLGDGPESVIVKSKTNKAVALAHVASLRSIDAADVCAFGDAANDVAMFRWAGQSVAPSNATPEIKGLASHRSDLSNDEDFIAAALAHLGGS